LNSKVPVFIDFEVEEYHKVISFDYEFAGFIVSGEADLPNEDSDHRRQYYQRGFHPHEEDVDELEKRTLERLSTKYAKDDYELDDVNDVDQQALLPSVRDPKLWLVKCAV